MFFFVAFVVVSNARIPPAGIGQVDDLIAQPAGVSSDRRHVRLKLDVRADVELVVA